MRQRKIKEEEWKHELIAVILVAYICVTAIVAVLPSSGNKTMILLGWTGICMVLTVVTLRS